VVARWQGGSRSRAVLVIYDEPLHQILDIDLLNPRLIRNP